ncbi:MAG: tRNA lysidine(34) synthetase TilS [Roseovarius sp.]
MDDLLGGQVPPALGLAVSGGGDSMAMLALADVWARQHDVQLWVITVDHGLRPEAVAEAQMVAKTCARMGHGHAIARWQWDGTGNMQARGREARLGLIDRWRGRLTQVLMGHTRDDVAETFLMRLERGAGVRGLAAMRADRPVAPQPFVPGDITGDMPPQRDSDKATRTQTLGRGGFRLLRPCLDLGRTDLRDYLSAQGLTWADDPSNADDRYDRVRMRALLAQWEDAGFGVSTMAAAASRLARARPALDARACDVWRQFGAVQKLTGEIHLSPRFTSVEEDTALRILSAALRFISSAPYGPRAAKLQALWQQMAQGQGGTLHGCELRFEKHTIRIFREYAALADHTISAAYRQVWDHRWIVNSTAHNGLTLRALGPDGWSQIETPPAGHPPFHAARSLPSLWQGAQLRWCGALGLGKPHDVLLRPMQMPTLSFADFLLSH